MSREIKFRAWHKENEMMLYPESKHNKASLVELTLDAWFDSENTLVIIMQYTGRKDKNGKEIYEDDIVQFLDEILKVFFNPYTACFDVEYLGGDCEPLVSGEWDKDDVKVIGNIHENPELFKGEYA